MKKIVSIAMLLMVVLWGCGSKSDSSEGLVVFETVEYQDYRSVVWNNKEYLPFSQVDPSDVGTSIGYFEEGGKRIYVCELVGQSSEQWVVTTPDTDNRNEAMAFREKGNFIIPEGMEPEEGYYWND